MDFTLTSEQSLLISTVRKFIADHLQPLEEKVELEEKLSEADARRIFEASKALGLYCVAAPAHLGGGGLSALDHMLVEEQFGRTTDILIRRAFGNFYEVLMTADDEQLDRWVRPCISGERTCSIAITEAEAGSDAAAIRTVAVRNGDGWSLTGSKHFISDGAHSDFFIVSAVTDPDKGSRGISLFLIDKEQDGVRIGRDQPMMGIAGTSHVEIDFDKVHLDRSRLLGGEGNGYRLILSTLGQVRLAQVGARAIGKATRILELATDYAASRRQFGQAIGDFQMIQQMLADSAMEIASARLLLLQTAWKMDQGDDARYQISMVKVQASETLGRVADRAVQIFGGMGFCRDLPIERYYRDARIYRIFDGTSEIHRSVIARGLLNGNSGLFDIA